MFYTTPKEENIDGYRRLIHSSGFDVNKKLGFEGITLLHVAVSDQNKKAVELLMKAGANPLIVNVHGVSALDIAHARLKQIPTHDYEYFCKSESILAMVLEGVNYTTDEFEVQQLTKFLFHLYFHEDYIQKLVDRGANINQVNVHGMTPLHFVCLTNKIFAWKKLLKCYLKNGADYNLKDVQGISPAMYGLQVRKYCRYSIDRDNKVEMVKFLLKQADMKSIDIKGLPIMLPTHRDVKNYHKFSHVWQPVLQHIAIMQALDLDVHSSFFERISMIPYLKKYYENCEEELALAKNTRFKKSWVSCFNLVVDFKRQLKNYAGNTLLIDDINKTDFKTKFPIYGALMQKNLAKGIELRRLFDEASLTLSECFNCPILTPNHLVIQYILDYMVKKKHLSKLTTSQKM